jgi:hypothetical protein
VVSSPVRAGSDAQTTDNRFTIASCKLSLGANWLRDAASYRSESRMVLSPEGRHTGWKKTGEMPRANDARVGSPVSRLGN